MKYKANIQAWQFYSNRKEEIIPCEDDSGMMELHVSIETKELMPQWLSKEFPYFYFRTNRKTYNSRQKQDLKEFYNVYVSIGEQVHMLLKEGDYIIRCANGRFMTMPKDDFESLFWCGKVGD